MANKNKFIDRSPYICPAGFSPFKPDTVKQCLVYSTIEDKISAIKYDYRIPDKKPLFTYKLPNLVNTRNVGVYTKVHKLLNKPAPTRYQTLINDLKETPYHSYWVAEVGKCKDWTGKLPLHIHPYVTTFGDKSHKDISVKELVNPDKTYIQVEEESREGRELYRKSHNDYGLQEHVDRNYLRPAYDPNRNFGERSTYDPRGIWMKCCLTDVEKEKYKVMDAIQTDYKTRFSSKLGKCHAPEKIAKTFPKDFTFGKRSNSSVPISELLTENIHHDTQKNIESYISFLTPLRDSLKNRFNRNLLSFIDLHESLKYYDNDHSGWIPLDTAYEICFCYRVIFEKAIMTKLLCLLGIVKNNELDYTKFMNIIDWQRTFPDIAACYYVPPEKNYFTTSYRDAQCDYKLINNSSHPPAGIPSVRYDISEPTIPLGGCRADLESFGSETDAATVIYPSVYTSYGLSFFDFFAPRGKQELYSIFANSGYQIDEAVFNKMWDEGYQLDKTGAVCVETFKNLLNKYRIEFVTEKNEKQNIKKSSP